MSSHKITVLIADDEAPARKRLKSLLEDDCRFQIISEAENGDRVLSEIIGKNPQVAFLDINMPGASVFNTIPSLKKPPLVVFQTAYSEYGVKAFDIDAVDYLMKPVSRQRFSKALEKVFIRLNLDMSYEEISAAQEKEPAKDVLSVKSGEAIRVIHIDKIQRISYEEGFSFIYTQGERVYSDKPLSYYCDLLGERGFYQISRKDIINLAFLSRLHPLFKGQYIAELLNGERMTVSRRRIQKLKELIG